MAGLEMNASERDGSCPNCERGGGLNAGVALPLSGAGDGRA